MVEFCFRHIKCEKTGRHPRARVKCVKIFKATPSTPDCLLRWSPTVLTMKRSDISAFPLGCSISTANPACLRQSLPSSTSWLYFCHSCFCCGCIASFFQVALVLSLTDSLGSPLCPSVQLGPPGPVSHCFVMAILKSLPFALRL